MKQTSQAASIAAPPPMSRPTGRQRRARISPRSAGSASANSAPTTTTGMTPSCSRTIVTSAASAPSASQCQERRSSNGRVRCQAIRKSVTAKSEPACE